MSQRKPTQKDFVDLINSVMGKNVMTEDQLMKFLHDAKHVKDNRGTEGLLEYVQRVTNAPASQSQLKKLADKIKETGNVGSALDYLKSEKLLSDQQARKLNQAIEQTKNKKKKK